MSEKASLNQKSEDLQAPMVTEIFECYSCKKRFKARRGLTQHQRLLVAITAQGNRPNSSKLELEGQSQYLNNTEIFQLSEVDGKEFTVTLRKRFPYSELFWSAFSRIQTE